MDNDQFTCHLFLPAPVNVLRITPITMQLQCEIPGGPSMRAGPPLFPLPSYRYCKCSGDEYYSKNVSAESETFICFLYISRYIRCCLDGEKSTQFYPVSTLPSHRWSLKGSGLVHRAEYSLRPLSSSFGHTNHHCMAYCSGLYISFSLQLGTMLEQDTASVSWRALEWLKSATWAYLTAILLPFSMGSHHSQIPPNLVSLVLESLLPPCLTLFCHLPLTSCSVLIWG